MVISDSVELQTSMFATKYGIVVAFLKMVDDLNLLLSCPNPKNVFFASQVESMAAQQLPAVMRLRSTRFNPYPPFKLGPC